MKKMLVGLVKFDYTKQWIPWIQTIFIWIFQNKIHMYMCFSTKLKAFEHLNSGKCFQVSFFLDERISTECPLGHVLSGFLPKISAIYKWHVFITLEIKAKNALYAMLELQDRYCQHWNKSSLNQVNALDILFLKLVHIYLFYEIYLLVSSNYRKKNLK